MCVCVCVCVSVCVWVCRPLCVCGGRQASVCGDVQASVYVGVPLYWCVHPYVYSVCMCVRAPVCDHACTSDYCVGSLWPGADV